MTSKRQVTVPKDIADQYGIRPGDELEWLSAGDTIRVIPPRGSGGMTRTLGKQERLKLFDQATERQRRRQAALRKARLLPRKPPADRGWKREELYARG